MTNVGVNWRCPMCGLPHTTTACNPVNPAAAQSWQGEVRSLTCECACCVEWNAADKLRRRMLTTAEKFILDQNDVFRLALQQALKVAGRLPDSMERDELFIVLGEALEKYEGNSSGSEAPKK